MKDLVDIAVYATTTDVDGSELQNRLRRELGARGLDVPKGFDVPPEWRGTYERVYTKLFRQTGLPEEYNTMDAAIELARELLSPVLAGNTVGRTWSHERLTWQQKGKA